MTQVKALEMEGPCCKEITSEDLELKVLKFIGKTETGKRHEN